MSVPTKCHWAPLVGEAEVSAALMLTVRSAFGWASLTPALQTFLDERLRDVAARIDQGAAYASRIRTEPITPSAC